MKDYNSAGFLAFILLGLTVAIGALLLLSDMNRLGDQSLMVQRENGVEILQRLTETPRSARF
jgi:hypothetical protein